MGNFEAIVLSIGVLVLFVIKLGEISDGPVHGEYNLLAGLSLVPTAIAALPSLAARDIQFGLFVSAPITVLFVTMWFINTVVFRGVMRRSVHD